MSSYRRLKTENVLRTFAAIEKGVGDFAGEIMSGSGLLLPFRWAVGVRDLVFL